MIWLFGGSPGKASHRLEPDPNGGVRLNIRPFIKAGDVKIGGAGALRDKPNIPWDKDRGKDAASAPRYKPAFNRTATKGTG
jgi:hypothetical protein